MRCVIGAVALVLLVLHPAGAGKELDKAALKELKTLEGKWGVSAAPVAVESKGREAARPSEQAPEGMGWIPGGAFWMGADDASMQDAGPVVWLKASVAELAARIDSDPATAGRRPNLAGGGIDEISRLLAERQPLYRECASIAIDTDGLAVCEILERIAAALGSPLEKWPVKKSSGSE